MDDAPEAIHVGARPPLLKQEKAALLFVITLGVLGMFLGGFYLWRHMGRPFVVSYTGPRVLVGDAKDIAEAARLRATDTDGDTISDYDELNVFKTSPYIPDSDSDGTDDGAEIAGGGDPNCARGQVCEADSVDAVAGASAGGGFEIEDAAQDEQFARIQETLSRLQSATPADVRQMLRDAGLPEEEISKLTDEEVNALYQAALSQVGEGSGWEEVLTPATP